MGLSVCSREHTHTPSSAKERERKEQHPTFAQTTAYIGGPPRYPRHQHITAVLMLCIPGACVFLLRMYAFYADLASSDMAIFISPQSRHGQCAHVGHSLRVIKAMLCLSLSVSLSLSFARLPLAFPGPGGCVCLFCGIDILFKSLVATAHAYRRLFSSGSRHSEMLCRALLLVFRARVIYGFRNKPAVGVHSNVGVPVRQARLKGSCCGRRCGFH